MLYFPRPAAFSSSSSSAPTPIEAEPPPDSSTSSRPLPPPSRAPPNNFASARAAARILREPKSPFVPKKAARAGTGHGERDLSKCSVDELTDMLAKNARLLDSPQVIAALPCGDTLLRSQQAKIELRLQELKDYNKMRHDLKNTHLDDDLSADGVKRENGDDDSVMRDEEKKVDSTNGTSELVNGSRRAKELLLDRIQTSPKNSRIGMVSLAESLELQRQVAQRELAIAAARAQQAEANANRPEVVGGLLKGAMKNAPDGMNDFFFTHDDSEEDEDLLLDDGVEDQQQQYELEEQELNPYRAAYESGYNEASREEG